jgi:hypothetical protein
MQASVKRAAPFPATEMSSSLHLTIAVCGFLHDAFPITVEHVEGHSVLEYDSFGITLRVHR